MRAPLSRPVERNTRRADAERATGNQSPVQRASEGAPETAAGDVAAGESERGDLGPYQRRADGAPSVARGDALQSALGQSPTVQRLAGLQTMLDGSRAVESLSGRVAQRRASGGGLPEALQSSVESLSGLAMDDVKVHYNSPEPAQLQAHAFTRGTDIHVAAGQERHLAHEAWHVVQQKQGRVAPTTMLKDAAINDDASLEKEADAMGDKALDMQSSGGGGGALVQRRAALRERTVQRAVVQRVPYVTLSPSQRAQVNAVSESTFYRKSELFQTRVQAVAAADPRGLAAVDALLAAFAVRLDAVDAAAAANVRAQNGTLAQKLQFLGGVAGAALGAANAFVTGAAREQIAQTTDFRPMIGAAPNPDFEQPVPNGQIERPTVENGQVRVDSRHARESRASKSLAVGAGSSAIDTIMRIATYSGVAAGVRENLKIALFANYIPAYSLSEILKSADAGLAAQGGLEIDQNLAPLTEGEIARLPPSYFLKLHFKDLLSKAMYPADGAERNAALDLMPADVRGWVQDIVGNVQMVQSDAALQPLLDLNVPRVLIERYSAARILAVRTFMGAPMTDGTIQALFAALGNDARATRLLAGIHRLNDGAGNAELQRFGRVAETLREGFTVGVEGGHGFGQAAIDEMTDNTVGVNNARYGPNDAGVALAPADFAGITDAANVTRALAIHDYTDTDYARYSTLYSQPEAPRSSVTGALDAAGQAQMTVRARALTSGLQMLPVFQGTVYVGQPSQRIPDLAALQAAQQRYRPGTMYAPQSPFSASKSVELSAWIQTSANPHVAFVIDDVKSGRDIQLISSQAGEREVLFPPSARFVIVRTQNQLVARADDANRFTHGTFWVYMREVGSVDGAADTAALNAEKAAGFREELNGRRFIDRAHYNAAERAYGREEVLDRGAVGLQGGGNAFVAPRNVYGAAQFTDWRAGADYVLTLVGHDLTADRVRAIHLRAGGNLLGAAAGQFRQGHVWAGGGLGPNGVWSALTNAQLAAVQANPALTFIELNTAQILGLRGLSQAQRDAHADERLRGLTTAHLDTFDQRIAAGQHVGLLRYPPPNQVDGLINTYVGDFNQRKQTVQALPTATPANVAAKQTAINAFAAWAQRQFVSIHPFPDGNGRTSRLLMDLVTSIFNQHPVLLEDTNQDLFSSQDEWSQAVGRGVGLTRTLGQKYGLV